MLNRYTMLSTKESSLARSTLFSWVLDFTVNDLKTTMCYHGLPKALEIFHLAILHLGLAPITKARLWSPEPYKPSMVGRAHYNSIYRRSWGQKSWRILTQNTYRHTQKHISLHLTSVHTCVIFLTWFINSSRPSVTNCSQWPKLVFSQYS